MADNINHVPNAQLNNPGPANPQVQIGNNVQWVRVSTLQNRYFNPDDAPISEDQYPAIIARYCREYEDNPNADDQWPRQVNLLAIRAANNGFIKFLKKLTPPSHLNAFIKMYQEDRNAPEPGESDSEDEVSSGNESDTDTEIDKVESDSEDEAGDVESDDDDTYLGEVSPEDLPVPPTTTGSTTADEKNLFERINDFRKENPLLFWGIVAGAALGTAAAGYTAYKIYNNTSKETKKEIPGKRMGNKASHSFVADLRKLATSNLEPAAGRLLNLFKDVEHKRKGDSGQFNEGPYQGCWWIDGSLVFYAILSPDKTSAKIYQRKTKK